VRRYFCTYFDRNYLTRGLALYESLRRYCPNFELWVLCLDKVAWQLLADLNLPDIKLIRMEEFEEKNPDLLAVKAGRNPLEYYFTCSPILPSFVLQKSSAINLITYLDADMWFFRNPEGIFQEIAEHSIAIVRHNFSPPVKDIEAKSGTYNVSWITFRRDEQGLECLNLWRKQCLDWCYDRSEGDRNGDQKYLDAWPGKFTNLKVIEQIGAGAAPWNVGQYKLSERRDGVYLNGQPLYFYHYHSLNRVNRWVYDPMLAFFKAKTTDAIKRLIYVPYICMLHAMHLRVFANQSEDTSFGNLRHEIYLTPDPSRAGFLGQLKMIARSIKWVTLGVYIFVPWVQTKAHNLRSGIDKLALQIQGLLVAGSMLEFFTNLA